jgi:hypothetical protein
VAVVRTALYLAATVALAGLLVLAGSFLVAVALLGAAIVLVPGDAAGLSVLALGVAGVLGVAGAAALLVTATRRLDRALLRASRRPDPIEAAIDRYVAGGIDERELEARVERALDPPDTAGTPLRRAGATLRRVGRRPVGRLRPTRRTATRPRAAPVEVDPTTEREVEAEVGTRATAEAE